MRTELIAPVRQVTVLEDRAQVRREGRISLPAGRVALRLAEVAPVLADKTLLVQAEGAEVVDARVLRRARARLAERPEQIEAREAERRTLQAERDALTAAQARTRHRLVALSRVRAQVLAELGVDAAWSRSAPERWRADLDTLDAQQEVLDAEVVDAAHAIQLLDRRLADLDRLIASLQSPEAHLGAEVEVELVVSEAGEVTVRLDYVVPGACWRPLHRAELAHGVLSVETFGCVWQHTGEGWTDVDLELSTQRASLGAEPPLLGEDELRARPKQEQVVVEARDEAIQTTGLGGGPAGSTAAAGLPGIDDGGEVRTMRATGAPSVPSDGRPHLVPLGAFSSEATVDLVAMPERAAAVVRRVRARNAGPVPLLAGPVELVADGGRVGRSTLLYVAPGERLEVGLGPDPALRVHRSAERVDHPPGTLSRWASTDHRVTVKLSNLGGSPRRLELVERLPVSEVEQVRVELDGKESSPGAAPDGDGLVRWTVDLEPGGTAERVLAWRVEKKKEVAGL